MVTANARRLAAGTGRGPVLWLDEPISLWGGVDPHDGRILDQRHPQAGRSVTGTILAMPYGRGSSSSPSVLAEMIRCGSAPAGVILEQADPMIVLGSLVAAELYRTALPVVVLADERLSRAGGAEIGPDARVKFH